MATVTDTLPDDAGELKANFAKELARKEKVIDELRQQLNTVIEALHLERQRHYGIKSEKNASQHTLFDEAEQENEEPVPPEYDTPTTAEPTSARKRSVRKPLPPELPRVERIHELAEPERKCDCGCTMNVLVRTSASNWISFLPRSK